MSNSYFKFKKFIVDHANCAMKVGTDGVLLGAWCGAELMPSKDVDNDAVNHPGPIGESQPKMPKNGVDETTRHMHHVDECLLTINENVNNGAASIMNRPIGNKYGIDVLDIGAGSGLISLMVAQRFENALIDAIEIDYDAFVCAKNNFSNSQWSDRLNAVHTSLEDFYPVIKREYEDLHIESDMGKQSSEGMADKLKKYDLIVSNPPYFENSLKADDLKRAKARHTDSLPYDTLIRKSASLLNCDGVLSLIYPFEADEKIEKLCNDNFLFCNRKSFVKGNPDSKIIRVLAEFGFSNNKSAFEPKTFSIEIERHRYTKEYIELTRDFYLKM